MLTYFPIYRILWPATRAGGVTTQGGANLDALWTTQIYPNGYRLSSPSPDYPPAQNGIPSARISFFLARSDAPTLGARLGSGEYENQYAHPTHPKRFPWYINRLLCLHRNILVVAFSPIPIRFL